MSTQVQSASVRTVVLLGLEERAKLDRLAAEEHASFGEILRRSLRAYDPTTADREEDRLVASILQETNAALDTALDSIQKMRSELRDTLDRIDRMREAAQ